jgi:hypothetical protein
VVSRNQNFQLTAYSDADWANYVDERKRTNGGAFFLGDSLVAWISKKQGSIIFFINYRGRVHCCYYLLHSGIMDDSDTCRLGGKNAAPIPIHCDKTSAISVSKNRVFHSKTKHIPIKYHFLRE